MPDTEFKYDVFLSHNGKDKPTVEQIARLLRDKYHQKVWLDKWNLVPGEAWQDALEVALDECQTFAVFLGPSGIGPWENEEMRSAIEERVQDKNRRVIPVLLPGAPDNRELKLPRFLRRATWVDFRSGLDDEEALYRLYCGITGQEPGDRSFLSAKVGSRKDWCLKHPYSEIPDFTGRVSERKMLSDWLKDEKHPLLILRALGGFGKSALAWYWIKKDLDPGTWTKVVWWSFYDDREFGNFIRESLEYLTGKPANPTTTRQDVENLLNELEKPGILLVLDGFERALRAFSSMDAAYQEANQSIVEGERATDCISPFAEYFLKGVSTLPELQGKALMTTRLRPRILNGHGGMLLTGCDERELMALDKADAVDFFRHLGIKGGRAEIESACEPYGYHPLSLRLLSGLIVTDLENPKDIKTAQKFNIIGSLKQKQHHVLEQSYHSLKSDRQRLFGRIACFRGSIDYKALKAITEKPETFDDDIHDFIERGLLHQAIESNRFDLHPIVRRYAYDQLTAADRRGAHERLVNYFEAVPTPEKVTTLEDLAPVIELYHHMVRSGKLDEARTILRDRLVPNPLHFQFGAYQLMIELKRALFPDGEDKPPRLKDESAQAWTLNSLANSYSLSGQPRRAVPLYEMQIVIREKLSDRKNVATGWGNVALQQLPIGALSEAERNLRRRIELCRGIKEERSKAIGYQELGRVLSYRGIWQEAERAWNSGLSTYEDIDDFQSQSVIWSYRAQSFLTMAREQLSLGSNQSLASSVKSSIDSAGRALELADETTRRQYSHPVDYMRAYWLLGAAYRSSSVLRSVQNEAISDLAKAEQNLSKAISICRQINMVYFEADILLELAKLTFARGDFKDASEKAEEALTITERCGYVLQGADVNLFLAELALEGYKLESEKSMSDKEAAQFYAKRAKDLATCDGPPYYYKVAYEEAERLLERLK